jgi:hypothetical protein
MAVVFTKSAALTARDTPGTALVGSYQIRGQAFNAVGKVEVANGDSIASILRVVTVPSCARIARLSLRCTAITSAAADIGLYLAPKFGGAVASVALFASAQSIASALVPWTDITNESTTITPTLVERRLWEVLGLSADPVVEYDIAFTLTAAATAAGQATLMVDYVI